MGRFWNEVKIAKGFLKGKVDHERTMALYRYCDLITPELVSKFKVSCSKGCSHCCYQLVELRRFEMKAVLWYVKRNKVFIDRQHLMKQRIIDWQDPGVEVRHRKCVFLNGDHRCDIYPVRPMACRSHFVVSESDLCDSGKHFRGTVVSIDKRPFMAASHAASPITPISDKMYLHELLSVEDRWKK